MLLIPLKPIIDQYKLQIKGIIHIGANIAQEYKEHLQCGINRFIYIEPLPAAFEQLKKQFINNKDVTLYNCACGEYNSFERMFLSPVNDGQSSSLLKPKVHLSEHPDVIFEGEALVDVRRLDDLPFDRTMYNMMEIDVQGYEDRVLRGAVQTLKHIDIINIEVNRGEVYEGCALVEQLDEVLSGYSRVKTFWMQGKSWGDAIYIKKDIINGKLETI